MSKRQKTDRQIVESQLKEAEGFWQQQKDLIAQGIIDRPMIDLAMGRLNDLHAKAVWVGCRDLIEPERSKERIHKTKVFWD